MHLASSPEFWIMLASLSISVLLCELQTSGNLSSNNMFPIYSSRRQENEREGNFKKLYDTASKTYTDSIQKPHACILTKQAQLHLMTECCWAHPAVWLGGSGQSVRPTCRLFPEPTSCAHAVSTTVLGHMSWVAECFSIVQLCSDLAVGPTYIAFLLGKWLEAGKRS